MNQNQNTTLSITTMSDLVEWMNTNDVDPETMIALTSGQETHYGSLRLEKNSTNSEFVGFSAPMMAMVLIDQDDSTHLTDPTVRVVTDHQERRKAISQAFDDLVETLPGSDSRENLVALLLAAGDRMATLVR